MDLNRFQTTKINQVLLLILSTVFMYGCGPKVKLNVYRDAPSIAVQKKIVEIKEVDKFIWGTNAPVLDTLNTMGYPIGFANEPYGASNTVMRHEYSIDSYDWKLSKNSPSAGRRAVFDNNNNHSLENDDVTIFEIKIVGLSNHIETTGSKRFSGPVPPFNWVELFKGRVPLDRKGYLMTATVALNYLDMLDIDDEIKYFVHFPVKFTENNDFSIKKGYGYYLFGNSKGTPFINFTYNKKKSATMRGCSIDDLNVNKEKSTGMDDGRQEFFERCAIKLGNKYYRHFFYMDPKFLYHRNMLKTPKTLARINRIELKKAARYSVYPNEKKLKEINKELNIARYYAYKMSKYCKGTARSNRELAAAIRTPKSRKRSVSSSSLRYDEHSKLLSSSQQIFAESMTTVGKWSGGNDGLGVTKFTLKNYKKMVEDMTRYLPEAEKYCEDERLTLSAISGASVRSSPGLLSIMGGAIQNKYRSNYLANNSSYSGGSSGGSSDSVGTTWKQINADLAHTYKKVIAEENAQKSQRQSAYQAKLKELQNQQSRNIKNVSAPAASRYRSGNKSSRRNVGSSNHQNNVPARGNSRTATSTSSNNRVKSTARNNINVADVSTTKKRAKPKTPCTGKFESLGIASKGQCGYVYSDYTRNARLDYGDYKLVLNSSSENGAKSDLKYALRNEAEKVCKASGYEFMVHENSFKHYELDWQVSACNDNGKKGVFKLHKCKGTASFVCGRRAAR